MPANLVSAAEGAAAGRGLAGRAAGRGAAGRAAAGRGTSASQVVRPTTPSARSLREAWKRTTAARVAGPKVPSAGSPSRACRAATAAPREPSRTVVPTHRVIGPGATGRAAGGRARDGRATTDGTPGRTVPDVVQGVRRGPEYGGAGRPATVRQGP